MSFSISCMWKIEAGRSPSNISAPMLKTSFTSPSRTGISIWSGFAIVDMSTFLSDLEFSRGLYARDHFVGRPHGVGEKSIVDHRGLIAVAPDRMPRSGGCVLDHCDLEALFEQLAQMGFDAHVRQHAAEDHLAQLQNEVVGLRAEDFVRADDDRLAVLDIGLEPINPVRARVGEPRQG